MSEPSKNYQIDDTNFFDYIDNKFRMFEKFELFTLISLGYLENEKETINTFQVRKYSNQRILKLVQLQYLSNQYLKQLFMITFDTKSKIMLWLYKWQSFQFKNALTLQLRYGNGKGNFRILIEESLKRKCNELKNKSCDETYEMGFFYRNLSFQMQLL
ncbi:unnamed protein product [Paramecium primaurelia]|uniref:Uncharacterized protein n=1 Tax=Paramecium primaurelia TaxID=5886 RepID=A0A8S1P9Q5_PARPR|nr:unnamed protein product [Paramecium primaurelia]